MSKVETWKDVWMKKGFEIPCKIELKNLIAADGFNIGTGKITVEAWVAFVKKIQKLLNINDKTKILEVGCGSGAFLFPMYSSGANVFGIDYSSSLIKLCSKAMPLGTFNVSDAKDIPFADLFFDVIISNSVFQYFEGLDYAKKVVTKMIRVLKKKRQNRCF